MLVSCLCMFYHNFYCILPCYLPLTKSCLIYLHSCSYTDMGCPGVKTLQNLLIHCMLVFLNRWALAVGWAGCEVSVTHGNFPAFQEDSYLRCGILKRKAPYLENVSVGLFLQNFPATAWRLQKPKASKHISSTRKHAIPSTYYLMKGICSPWQCRRTYLTTAHLHLLDEVVNYVLSRV
jgi:hypothetical protein